MLRLLAPLAAFSLLLSGCSSTVASSQSRAKTYAAGEKAIAGPLTYSIVDTQIQPDLGTDDNRRTPSTRFILIRVSTFNSSNAEVPIPAMTLIDDSGKTYPELADGTGVADWLGIVRKVGPGQTDSGQVAFDAPSQHYRLRLTDANDDSDVGIDIPLDFIHEQLRDTSTIPGAVGQPDQPGQPQAPAGK
jgi:hypothetical protein